MSPLGDDRPVQRVPIGEWTATGDDHVISMLVGSCIGLFVWDRPRRRAAAAHIALPTVEASAKRTASSSSFDAIDQPARYAETAVAHLVDQLSHADPPHRRTGIPGHPSAQPPGSARPPGSAQPPESAQPPGSTDGNRLIAKMAGGASMFGDRDSYRVGPSNREQTLASLRVHTVDVVAEHCGGVSGRRLWFCPGTGRMVIEMVGNEPVEI